MILGLGTDLVSVSRFKSSRKRSRSFDRKVFTRSELAYARRFKDADERLAARFAAKEAVMKALGTGWAKGIAWTDVEVVNERGGRPRLKVSGGAARLARSLRIRCWHLSLSHADGYAVAVVIAEGGS